MLAPLYTADEMKAAEAGHDVPTLMERAGNAVADEAQRRFPRARRFAVYAGKGANGGDGKIAARILGERGWQEVEDDADVVIDALLGTGMRGAPRPVSERGPSPRTGGLRVSALDAGVDPVGGELALPAWRVGAPFCSSERTTSSGVGRSAA